MSDDIFVTKPFLPPLKDFLPYLETIWDGGILSNGGPFHTQFEEQLAEYLGVPFVCLFSNGTIALLTALQAVGARGDVVTTPFSFVATSHAVMWNNLCPVFADIEAHSLNLDPAAIEAAITPETTTILPVHCYGNPAATNEIGNLADRHGLKVIYDASHAFGVEDTQGSILNHGDLATLSLHATKVFNTFEGGAIICKTAEMKDRIDKLKNFGHDGETVVVATGINGKMSEFNSAFGLLQLRHIDWAISRRMEICKLYRAAIDKIVGLDYLDPELGGVRANGAYFPILVRPEYRLSRDALYEKMKSRGVHPRRYFYPLITSFSMYKHLPSSDPARLPVANLAADQVLCLPIYPDLSEDAQLRVIDLLQAS